MLLITVSMFLLGMNPGSVNYVASTEYTTSIRQIIDDIERAYEEVDSLIFGRM